MKPVDLPALSDLLDRLMPSSLRTLVRVLTEFLQLAVGALGASRQPKGLYEVLDYKASLDVLDAKGRTAVYQKRERVRFLRDQVTSFPDFGWGTGETFASHRVRPGRIVERRPVGPRHRSLVVLAEPQNRGDELTFEVRRLIRKGITGKRNWLEAEVNQPMGRLALCVTLPASRRVRGARLLRHREAAETAVAVRTDAQGKQQLSVRVVKPQLGELYTLEWGW